MISVVALLAGAFAVHSQGTVAFGNYLTLNYIYVSLSGILLGGASTTTTGIPLADAGNGNDWSVALYGSAGTDIPGNSLQQATSDGTFGTPATATMEDGDAPPGLWFSDAIADIPGTTGANQAATVQVRVWYNGGGAYPTYNSAVASGVPYGESATGNVVTGGPQPPAPPLAPPDLPPLGNIVLFNEGGPIAGPSSSGDGYDYIVTGNAITLTAYTGTNQVVTVPATINNMAIASISRTGAVGLDYAGAFSNDKVTSVTISPGALVIGVNAFGGCLSLTNVTIPDSVFYFDTYAFSFCTALSSLVIPNSVAYIGDGAFFNSGLTSISIPGSVATVDLSAFYGCESLTNVTINDGVGSLNYESFYGCTNLTSVKIPASLSGIAGAFADCTSLTNIAVDPANPNFTSMGGILFDKSLTTFVEYPAGLPGIYAIPANITNIHSDAFTGCPLLTSITIPAGVVSIGPDAFSACGVTNIYFLGNAPSVDSSVFSYDTGTVYILPGTTGWAAFAKSTGISPVAWNPRIEASGSAFGVRNNQFGFNITGTTNIPIVVEACTGLAQPVWMPLQSMTLTNGLIHFSEPIQFNSAARLYRISAP
jgi:hypothetical protein